MIEDTIVIGGGIVGATIALALENYGRKVKILDNGQELAGTKASGGHLKPSWFGGMKKKDYDPAMELLDDVWGIKEEEYVIRPIGKTATVYRVDTDSVTKAVSLRLARPLTAMNVRRSEKVPVVEILDGKSTYEVKCRLLVVAAGAWTGKLFPEVKVRAKQGVSYRFRGKLDRPFIKPWAPYKQIVAHQQDKRQIWIGDGTAVLQENWTKERERQSLERCRKALSGKVPARIHRGLRPYIQTGSDPCLILRIGKRTWVVTGAGKMGTIAAGWAARRIVNAVC